MYNIRAFAKPLLMAATLIAGLASCDKLNHPSLPANYPKDTNVTPATSLRFSLPFDSTTADAKQINIRFADSISGYPCFFPDGSITAGPGVKGTAFQSAGSSYIHYYNANDMGSAKSFTLAFWLNVPLAKKDNNHAVGVLAFANSSNFWGNATFYADNNAKSPSDSMDLKIHFNAPGNGDDWNFAGYNFDHAWPHMYDGKWHQVAFTYDSASATGTVYRDGVQFDQKTGQSIRFENASQLILGGYQEAAGIKDTYANNTWMAGFPGLIDEVRLYGVALSATDIATLYNNKQ